MPNRSVLNSSWILVQLQFHHSVASDSLWPLGLHHTRPLCPSLTPGVYSSSCPLSQCDAIQPSHPLCLLLLLPSIFPSIRVFSNESVLHIRWPKYWSFNFNISPFSEYSGLISFRIDWLDLLAVQGTLKSLLHVSIWQKPLQYCKVSSLQLIKINEKKESSPTPQFFFFFL